MNFDNDQILEDIKIIIDYLYEDERKNMEALAISAAGNDNGDIVRKNHIFNNVKRLSQWIGSGQARQQLNK